MYKLKLDCLLISDYWLAFLLGSVLLFTLWLMLTSQYVTNYHCQRLALRGQPSLPLWNFCWKDEKWTLGFPGVVLVTQCLLFCCASASILATQRRTVMDFVVEMVFQLLFSVYALKLWEWIHWIAPLWEDEHKTVSHFLVWFVTISVVDFDVSRTKALFVLLGSTLARYYSRLQLDFITHGAVKAVFYLLCYFYIYSSCALAFK